MLKNIFSLFVILLVILSIVIAWKREDILAHYISKAYGEKVTIEDLVLEPGRVILKGFTIPNTRGEKVKTALRIERLTLHAGIWSFFAKTVSIPLITANNATLGIEIFDEKGDDTNWSTLIQELSDESPQTDRRWKVDKVVINDLKLQVYVHPLKTWIKVPPFEHLEFDDIAIESGLPLDLISARIYKAVVNHVKSKGILPLLLQASKGIPKAIIKPLAK